MKFEIEESNAQFIGAFGALARGAGGVVKEFGGVSVMFSQAHVFFLNSIGLSTPVYDRADLMNRAREAVRFARSSEFPYFIVICQDFLPPELRDKAAEAFIAQGLEPIMQWTGMVADRLTPPARKSPELEIRPVSDEQTRIAVNDINCISYGMPPEPGREVMARDAMWQGSFGSVGYHEGMPVATATTMLVDGHLYVAMVATLPDYRQRGYAEACMRDSLRRASEASGLERTVLHATDMGHPVYSRMGFRDVTKFQIYAEAHE